MFSGVWLFFFNFKFTSNGVISMYRLFIPIMLSILLASGGSRTSTPPQTPTAQEAAGDSDLLYEYLKEKSNDIKIKITDEAVTADSPEFTYKITNGGEGDIEFSQVDIALLAYGWGWVNIPVRQDKDRDNSYIKLAPEESVAGTVKFADYDFKGTLGQEVTEGAYALAIFYRDAEGNIALAFKDFTVINSELLDTDSWESWEHNTDTGMNRDLTLASEYAVYPNDWESMKIEMKNNSDKELTYGVDWTLLKNVDGRWLHVPKVGHMAIPSIGYLLYPGGQGVAGDTASFFGYPRALLTKGDYAFVKEYFVSKGGDVTTAHGFCQFKIDPVLSSPSKEK
jgi:hypothetical protein